MIKRRTGDKVLISKIYRLAKIVKILDEGKYLVSYYNNDNIYTYKVIEDSDILDRKQYELIRKRINFIRKLSN